MLTSKEINIDYPTFKFQKGAEDPEGTIIWEKNSQDRKWTSKATCKYQISNNQNFCQWNNNIEFGNVNL